MSDFFMIFKRFSAIKFKNGRYTANCVTLQFLDAIVIALVIISVLIN